MKLSEFLKDYRLDRGLSQEALSNIIGLSRITCNGLESGRAKSISVITLKKISNFTGKSIADIREMFNEDNE